MTHPKQPMRRVIAFSAWLYGFFLHAYPATFRDAYGSRMLQVFQDSCRDTLQKHGLIGLVVLWLHVLSDLTITVPLERWHSLKEKVGIMTETQHFPLRLWIALIATVLAFVVSLVASLNLYLLEDTSQFTQAAYSASPLLRFSYDGIYLSALAAGVGICAVIGYALVQNELLVSHWPYRYCIAGRSGRLRWIACPSSRHLPDILRSLLHSAPDQLPGRTNCGDPSTALPWTTTSSSSGSMCRRRRGALHQCCHSGIAYIVPQPGEPRTLHAGANRGHAFELLAHLHGCCVSYPDRLWGKSRTCTSSISTVVRIY